MEDLQKILRCHRARYPLMQPQDAVKLLYQNEFGGGHIIEDADKSLRYIREEWAERGHVPGTLQTENIGNGLCRLNLLSLSRDAELTALNRIFVKSAAEVSGSPLSMREKLRLLDADAAAYVREYSAAGYPMVSHSEIYRAAYRPAYRVVKKKYAALLPLLSKIEQALCEKGGAILAIDGMCGSGKSTLAQYLQSLYGAAVIPMDDFFLPPALRTEERLREPGGNVDYDRFRREVAGRIGGRVAYRPFDCGRMDFGDEKTVPPAEITVIEGSYSLNPKCGLHPDIRVFTRISGEEQLRRIRERDGEDALSAFIARWIPMENRYFDALGVEDSCDLTLRLMDE